MPNAKLGAKVDRYSFFVRFLPPLLHTGLARRTSIAITIIDHAQPAPPTSMSKLACSQQSGEGSMQFLHAIENYSSVYGSTRYEDTQFPLRNAELSTTAF